MISPHLGIVPVLERCSTQPHSQLYISRRSALLAPIIELADRYRLLGARLHSDYTLRRPMLHTVQEAMLLTGLSRKSLYNHMTSGRTSYSVGADGRRYFDTAELERSYGKLKTVTHPSEPGFTQPSTQPLDPAGLTQMIEDAVHRATAPLVAEIAELKATLMRIEHQPDVQGVESAPADPAPAPLPASKPKSIGDLLDNWD